MTASKPSLAGLDGAVSSHSAFPPSFAFFVDCADLSLGCLSGSVKMPLASQRIIESGAMDFLMYTENNAVLPLSPGVTWGQGSLHLVHNRLQVFAYFICALWDLLPLAPGPSP